MVAEDRLRFDFTHTDALTPANIQAIETRVNQVIQANVSTEKSVRSLQEAKAMGAMALFGEKYSNKVKVIKFGDFSCELCGGTHVNATGEIGLFKIISQASVASGVRRIEAVAGEVALQWIHERLHTLHHVCQQLKTTESEVARKVTKLQEKAKQPASAKSVVDPAHVPFG